MLTRLTTTCIVAIGLLGCEPQRPDIIMPIGHPADPAARSGRSLPIPAALAPELVTATPTIGSATAPQPRSMPTRGTQGGHGGHSQ